MNAEVGIGDPRTPVAELGEQGAGLGFVAFESPRGCTVDRTGVPVIAPHPVSGVAFRPLLGNGVLRLERKQIVIASRLAVQQVPYSGKVAERVAKLGQGIRRAHMGWLGLPKL